MAKGKHNRQLAIPGDSNWLTLKEAAKLCNSSQAELRNQIEQGKLRAFTVSQGGKIRFRLLKSSLIDAGLIGKAEPQPEPVRESASVELLALIRDQNQRISNLEDQRAHLAGQLGVALERLRSIDERLTDLESVPESVNVIKEIDLHNRNGKGKQRLKSSILKVVAVSPSPKRWKKDKR